MTEALTITDEATTEAVATIWEHAAGCGKLDCGHLGRGPSRDVRRAVILYVAEGAGYPAADLRRILEEETTGVQAVYGALQGAQHARPTYVRGTTESGNRGYVRATPNMVVMPNAEGIRITNERFVVYSWLAKGYSATEVARMTSRAVETVKSHTGWLRRLTGAHDSVSALVALALAEKIPLD